MARVFGWIEQWARHSQEGACRNAMVASTAALERRRQREEVEAYLAGHRVRRTPMPAAAVLRTGTRG